MGRLLCACGYAVVLHESAESLLAQPRPDLASTCILLDVRMPGLSGPELQTRLNDAGLPTPIVFLTGHADVCIAVQVIKAGAEYLLTKPVRKDTLLAAIERALARGRLQYEEHRALEGFRRLVSALTPRERQVFERVANGLLNKQIASELGSTERTVKAHRHNLMQKLGVRSLVELVLIAERLEVLAWPANHFGQPPAASQTPARPLQRAETADIFLSIRTSKPAGAQETSLPRNTTRSASTGHVLDCLAAR